MYQSQPKVYPPANVRFEWIWKEHEGWHHITTKTNQIMISWYCFYTTCRGDVWMQTGNGIQLIMEELPNDIMISTDNIILTLM
jgi:hypothetical protein